MGGKRKATSKASKLARMTEEEKLRYLQHRAAVEQEAARRKQQLVSSFLKNKLKHEEAFTRLNSAKINQQWRQTLRRIKCKELQDTTETLRQTFDVAITTKNKIIQNLQVDLKDCNTQHAMTHEFHLDAIDNLLDLHKERVNILRDHYVSTKKRLLDEATGVKTEVNECYRAVSGRLDIVNLAGVNEIELILRASRQEKSNKRDRISYKLMYDTRAFEQKMSAKLNRLKTEMDEVKRQYLEKVEPVESHYLKLRSRDDQERRSQQNNCRVILDYETRISRLSESHASVKNKYETDSETLTRIAEALNRYKENLRCFLREENHDSQRKLTSLAAVSNSVIQELEKFADKAEEIQMVIGNCKKYLTEREKLLPSFCNGPDLGCQQSNMERSPPLDQMKHFWFRHSQLILECQELKVHRNQFLKENSQLKSIMRHYLTTVSLAK